jgi:hypothetical protein
MATPTGIPLLARFAALPDPRQRNRGITPGCQWPQAGSPRQRMRSGSCGTEGPLQTPSLAPR